MATSRHLLLYDGVCGLCNRLNQFVLRRDRADRFVFASLQSRLGGETLARYGRSATDLDTFYAIADYGTDRERLIARGRAAMFVLRAVGGFWWFVGTVGSAFPTFLLDFGYDFVARRRYRWFGRSETCLLPEPRYKAKFLDAGA